MLAFNLFLSNVVHGQKISHILSLGIMLSALICLISPSARHKGKTFTTIATNQWFLKVTIAIDGMVTAQPLGPMVFRWFFSQPTIGDNVFQWLPTIGPTMRW